MIVCDYCKKYTSYSERFRVLFVNNSLANSPTHNSFDIDLCSKCSQEIEKWSVQDFINNFKKGES